jgi:hypothetical protein
MISAPAIQFKGSGWYVTDYAGASRKAGEKLEKESSSSDEKKSDKKTKDSSPAKKTTDKASSPRTSSSD